MSLTLSLSLSLSFSLSTLSSLLTLSLSLLFLSLSLPLSPLSLAIRSFWGRSRSWISLSLASLSLSHSLSLLFLPSLLSPSLLSLALALSQELLGSLTEVGLLRRSKVKGNSAPGHYAATWEVYATTPAGRAQLAAGGELRLAVPQSLRRAEEEQAARRRERLAELERGGVDLSQVEREEGSE